MPPRSSSKRDGREDDLIKKIQEWSTQDSLQHVQYNP
jgi:hypothetical protein